MKLNNDVVLFPSVSHLLQEVRCILPISLAGNDRVLSVQNYSERMQHLFDEADVVRSTRLEDGQQGKTLLLPYIRENFASIASAPSLLLVMCVPCITNPRFIAPLAMWDTPRGMHNHSLVINHKGNMYRQLDSVMRSSIN